MKKRSIPRLSDVSRGEAEIMLEGVGAPFILTDTLAR
jgi:hypothetical protein